MTRHIRSLAAALATASVVLGGAAPALAAAQDHGMKSAEQNVPVWLDAMVLRPFGLVMTAGGAVLAVIPTAFVAVTRPTDIVKPLDYFVGTPFRYTFMDPLGEHPVTGPLDD